MRFLVLIVVSIVLAVGVIFFMAGQKQPVAQVEDGHWVLVSRMDIEPGSFVKSGEQFSWQQIDDSKYEEKEKSQFMRKAETKLEDIDGAVVRSFIKANEPVLRKKLVTPQEGGFMSAVLYPGMRAMTVGVTLVSGNAGFIFPGDKVDLLLTHEVDDESGKQGFATETFIQDIRVLAIDQKTSNPERQAFIAKTVTIEVTPKQAEEVLVAEELGKISLILRSMGSVTFTGVDTIDMNESTKGYTLDNDVSKIITHKNPIVNSGSVIVTRGRSTENVTVNTATPEPTGIPQTGEMTTTPIQVPKTN